ncbi:hypothetical protein ACJMK2_027326 [Sinanodonta woodiana]|uniref:Uncharacterized protein n=1 Tax=Sinanodonta woodiana TaxID=1069815 RepID=A0ABD3XMG7_SINWO
MERIPTFFHTCSKMPNVPKGKRGRDSTSPTPKQEVLPCQDYTGQRKTNIFLTHILEAGGVSATGVNPFWNEFANKLNKCCGSSGTGSLYCFLIVKKLVSILILITAYFRYQKAKNLFPVGVAQEIQTDTFSL